MDYYVCCLVDSRDKEVFYIGKGVNNRFFAHARDVLESEATTDKLDKIWEIIADGHMSNIISFDINCLKKMHLQ